MRCGLGMVGSLARSGVVTLVVVVALASAVWWTWPGEDLEAYQGQVEIAEVQNNETARGEIAVLAVQSEGVRGAREEIVVDELRATLDPGGSRGPALLACTDEGHIAGTLKVEVAWSSSTDTDQVVVPLDPDDCEPDGGTSFRVTLINSAIVVHEVG